MKKKLIGKRIKVIKGDYKGRTGTIGYCPERVCRCYRIQFDNIGNSEKLSSMKSKIEFIK